jgi:glycosyltransferase involved in cell wall biosynthesis
MDISVVVPFYNEERYIESCVKALLSQSYPADRYEIIMVDNNSTDRSVEIVKRYPCIKLLSEHKQGSYGARNQGIAQSKGGIIAFTDADCSPCTDWLQRIADAMRSPDVSIVQGRMRFASDSAALSMLAAYESEKAAFVFSSHTKEIYYGYTNNMAVRRGLFDRLGPFLEMGRGADVVFMRRAIDEYSCDVVRYSLDACVRHLEMTDVWKYYRKQLIYGRSYRSYGKIASTRPLTTGERLEVFKRTIRRGRYSLAKSAGLFLLLSIGGVCYELADGERPGS